MSAARRAPTFGPGDGAPELLRHLAHAARADQSLSLETPRGYSVCLARRHMRDGELWQHASDVLADRMVHHYRETVRAWAGAVAPRGMMLARLVDDVPHATPEEIARLVATDAGRYARWSLNLPEAPRGLREESYHGATRELSMLLKGLPCEWRRSPFDVRRLAMLRERLDAQRVAKRWEVWSEKARRRWVQRNAFPALVVVLVPPGVVSALDDGRSEACDRVEDRLCMESSVILRGLRPEHVVRVFARCSERPEGMSRTSPGDRAAFALDGALQADFRSAPWADESRVVVHPDARAELPEGVRVRRLPIDRYLMPTAIEAELDRERARRLERMEAEGDFVSMKLSGRGRRVRLARESASWFTAYAAGQTSGR